MADISDVLEMISSFELIGLRNGPDLSGREKKIAVATAWSRAMSDVSPPDLQVAAEKWIELSPFWPTPAEVRKLCPTIQKKQLETQVAKESGIGWFGKVVAAAGSYGPRSPNAMARIPGTMSAYQADGKVWERGRQNLIAMLAEENPAILEALGAAIDAVGWKSFHEDGWKYRENRMRETFEKAFAAAYDKYLLDHPKYNVIDFQERKRIASEGKW